MEYLPIPEDKPYASTIMALKAISKIECPVEKITEIYNCLKFELAKDIDEFQSRVDQDAFKIYEKYGHDETYPASTAGKEHDPLNMTMSLSKKRQVMDIDNL